MSKDKSVEMPDLDLLERVGKIEPANPVFTKRLYDVCDEVCSENESVEVRNVVRDTTEQWAETGCQAVLLSGKDWRERLTTALREVAYAAEITAKDNGVEDELSDIDNYWTSDDEEDYN